MLVHKPYGSRRFLSLLILLIAFIPAGRAAAAIEGDYSALDEVITRYRENVNKIKTWSGKVKLELETTESKDVVDHIKADVEYFWDLSNDRSRYRLRTTSDNTLKGDKESPRVPLMCRNGMQRDGAYYAFIVTFDNIPNKRRVATISAESNSRPGFSYGSFDPLFFLTYSGERWDSYWESLKPMLADEAMVGHIDTRDQKMTFVQKFGNGAIVATFVFDLAKGGNPITLDTVTSTPDAEEKSHFEITWKSIDGIWLPKSLLQTNDVDKPNYSRRSFRLTWTSQEINAPIADAEFSLPALGLLRGDEIHDTRIGLNSNAEGNEFPLEGQAETANVAP